MGEDLDAGSLLKKFSGRCGIRRGEPALIACRNAYSTIDIIAGHLDTICKEREKLIQDRLRQDPDYQISDYEYKQLQLIDYTRRNGVKIIDAEITDFMDGEIRIRIGETLTGKDVYLMQNTLDPREPQKTSHNIIEMELMIDALQRSEAAHVNLILPYMSYCKQERRQGREPISANTLIDKLGNAGVERMTTMDLHADAIEGFTKADRTKIQNLYASSMLLSYFLDVENLECVWIAPDPGAGKKVKYYSKVSGYHMALGYKYRDPEKMHQIDEQKLLGNVKDNIVVIIDDQTAGSGTLLSMAKTAKDYGAKKVYAGVTHGMLLGDAEFKFKNAYKEGIIEKIIMTNTLIQPEDLKKRNEGWLVTLDALHMFADAIFETHVDGSISRLYEPMLRQAMYGKNHKALDAKRS